jgi:hypothetical protein
MEKNATPSVKKIAAQLRVAAGYEVFSVNGRSDAEKKGLIVWTISPLFTTRAG